MTPPSCLRITAFLTSLVLVTGAQTTTALMPDGKLWTTQNLALDISPSWCYEDLETNCSQDGRLYTWDSAHRACASLGDGWRLPNDDEWQQLAKLHGGTSAFTKLLRGGGTPFNAILAGGRDLQGTYARRNAHGFYWTSTETDASHAVFYNFTSGSKGLFRQPEGEKLRAFSVRCIRGGRR